MSRLIKVVWFHFLNFFPGPRNALCSSLLGWFGYVGLRPIFSRFLVLKFITLGLKCAMITCLVYTRTQNPVQTRNVEAREEMKSNNSKLERWKPEHARLGTSWPFCWSCSGAPRVWGNQRLPVEMNPPPLIPPSPDQKKKKRWKLINNFLHLQ